MKAFVIGATGYIGGAIAVRFKKEGFEVVGMTSSKERGEKLRDFGIEPYICEMSDIAKIAEGARNADIVVSAADSDARETVEGLLKALEGTDKVFIHTSGSSIIADTACGELSDRFYDDYQKFEPVPDKVARVAIDDLVKSYASKGLHTAVICPCMIYGEGAGPKKESQQIPNLIKQAKKSGVARHIGKGMNVWSTVHIDDLVELYTLAALRKAPAGAFLFAENGEVNFKTLVETIKEGLKLSTPVEDWTFDKAVKEWGHGSAMYGLGSNSRIRGLHSRTIGWTPHHNDVVADTLRACKSENL